MSYVWAFVVGGAICVVGQLFIDYTKLSPARILTGYVVAGVILSAVGLYKPLADFAGAGVQRAAAGVRAFVGTGRAECRGRVRPARCVYRRPDGGVRRHSGQPDFWRAGCAGGEKVRIRTE